MTLHDQSKGARNIMPHSSGLDQYFVNITVDCPYGLPRKAVYRQALFTAMPDETLSWFFDNGYRRNGNYLYTMRCPGCRACVPIRVRPADFTPNRNQRRVFARNKDIRVGVAPLSMSRENLELLEKFLVNRFPGNQSSAASYYSGFFLGSLVRGFEIRYRLDERLIGVAIVDGSVSWLNAVYFYFDPDYADRSPGTFNILYLLHFCRLHNIELLYLGYWIEEVQAMAYKANFKPHEILGREGWQTVGRIPAPSTPESVCQQE